MTSSSRARRLLAASLITATTAFMAVPAMAQDDTSTSGGSGIASRHGTRPSKKKEEAAPVAPARYPSATRVATKNTASSKGAKALNAMLELYNAQKPTEARAAADAIIANDAMNAYDKAFAARIAAQVAVQANDDAAALRYAQQAIDANALDNDDHIDLLLLKSQLQLRAQDYSGALASVDAFRVAAGADTASSHVVRGNAQYRLGKYAEAATALKQAIAAEPGHADWQALLVDALNRSGNSAEATKLAEAGATDPGNADARMNLVQTYLQSKQNDKALALLEQMRTAGQLTDVGYQQLFSLSANQAGKEKQTIDVANEAIAKGLLKPDYNVYVALAQSYYFSEQPEKAIEYYGKAAPLGKDGQAFLNLASVLVNEKRIPEAKAAAQKALDKGLENPDAAKKILALSAK